MPTNTLTVEQKKIAAIVSRPTRCSDDGRALGLEWQLFLNDHGGRGFWHGGPGYPDHASTYATEDHAKAAADALGYAVTSTSWT